MKLMEYYKKLYNTCSKCKYRNVEFPNDPCWSCINNVYGNKNDETKTDNYIYDANIYNNTLVRKINNGK